MFKFNPNLLRIQYVKLISVTSALGGAIRIVDDENENSKGIRIEIPFAVARAFIKKYKTGKFYVPIEGCLVWYGDSVVNIEKKSEYSIDGKQGWKSACEHVINRFLLPLLDSGSQQEKDNWYTDGIAIFQIPKDAFDDNHEPLTLDNKFKAITVRSIKFKDLSLSQLVENPATTSCVQFTTESGKKVLSPPIWNNVLDIRKNVEGGVGNYRFDVMNEHLAVNLEFVLSAAKTIGEHFGFEYTIPLRLEDYMINLNTVNLPNLDKSIREVYTVNMSFTVAFAWLLGFCELSETLTQYVAVRSVIKMLCTKGTFSHHKNKVLENFKAPEMIDSEQALQHALTLGSLELDNYFMNGGSLTDTSGVEQVLVGDIF